MNKTPVVLVTTSLTIATVLTATFLIVTSTRGENTSFASSAGQLDVQTVATGLVNPWALAFLTDGRIKVQVFPAGALGAALKVSDTVKNGVAELGHLWMGYDWGQDTTTVLFGGYAGSMDTERMLHWIYEGGGLALWRQFRDETAGVVSLPCFIRTAEVFLHSRKPVRTLADLKGLKLRTAGAWLEMSRQMGAAPVTTPGGEEQPAVLVQCRTTDEAERSRLRDESVLAGTRPAPTPPWRQAAVGPIDIRQPTTRPAVIICDRNSPRCPRRTAVSSAHPPSASRSSATSRQAPGADSHGSRPKPPASDPAMAPAVLAA